MNTDGFLGDICPVIRVYQWFTRSFSGLSWLLSRFQGSRHRAGRVWRKGSKPKPAASF